MNPIFIGEEEGIGDEEKGDAEFFGDLLEKLQADEDGDEEDGDDVAILADNIYSDRNHRLSLPLPPEYATPRKKARTGDRADEPLSPTRGFLRNMVQTPNKTMAGLLHETDDRLKFQLETVYHKRAHLVESRGKTYEVSWTPGFWSSRELLEDELIPSNILSATDNINAYVDDLNGLSSRQNSLSDWIERGKSLLPPYNLAAAFTDLCLH